MNNSSTALAPPAAARTLEALDLRHLIHPHQTTARPDRRVFVRGKGCSVWNADGVEFLDVMGGGNWLTQVGHGRPEMAEAAAAQLGRLEFFSCWQEYANDKAIQLAARLADLAPDDLNRVFFTCGGSEGIDTAIKIARRFHYDRGEPDRTWVMTRRMGYHGCTLGSGAATGFDVMQYGVGPVLPHIEKVTPPMPYRRELFGGQPVTDFLLSELDETIARIGASRIAAMIGEPVMGGAGVVVPPPDYWPRVHALLKKHGILLIADEVITGYGRTGHWFSSESHGMEADIIVTAKGLTSGYAPLGAVIMRDEIGSVMTCGETLFFHGHTYFGHPVSCALGLANLDLLESEGLLGRAVSIGDWFQEGLAPARQLPVVGEIRTAGAMIGVELVTDHDSRDSMPSESVIRVVDELLDVHQVIVRDYGSTIVMGPPLVLSQQQVDRACAALVEVLARLDGNGSLRPR
jgi:PLP-dependent transaminase